MSTSPIDALVERGEDKGCVNLSEFSELTQELSDEEAQALADRLEARGVDVTDDCGRESEPGPSYAIDDLSVKTGPRGGKLSGAERELAVELERTPTDEEIAKRADISLKELEETREYSRTVTSLERPVGEEGDTELGDLLPSDAPEPVEEVEIGLRQEAVHRALENLSEQEQAVIRLRYGINGDSPTPLREAGKRLGLSPERVRRVGRSRLRGSACTPPGWVIARHGDFHSISAGARRREAARGARPGSVAADLDADPPGDAARAGRAHREGQAREQRRRDVRRRPRPGAVRSGRPGRGRDPRAGNGARALDRRSGRGRRTAAGSGPA